MAIPCINSSAAKLQRHRCFLLVLLLLSQPSKLGLFFLLSPISHGLSSLPSPRSSLSYLPFFSLIVFFLRWNSAEVEIKDPSDENRTLSKILSFKPGGSQNNYSFVCFIYSQNICVSNVYLPRIFTPFLSNPLQTLRDVYGRNESDFYM